MSGTVERSPVVPRLEPEGALKRLGMIALATDLTSERDGRRLIPPERAALHVSRVAYANPTTPENLRRMAPRLTEAADLLLPGVTLAGLYYSCTAASVAIGEAAVAEAIARARPGVPVVTPTSAALQAFAALGVGRIALVTPYLVETTEPMADYFRKAGLEIVTAHCLGMDDDRQMARVSADTIEAAALAADSPRAEALFLSCTALPAVGALARIEARLGKPVISSNQAGFWRLLHHAGVPAAADAPGRLFTVAPLEHAA